MSQILVTNLSCYLSQNCHFHGSLKFAGHKDCLLCVLKLKKMTKSPNLDLTCDSLWHPCDNFGISATKSQSLWQSPTRFFLPGNFPKSRKILNLRKNKKVQGSRRNKIGSISYTGKGWTGKKFPTGL